MRLQTGTLLLLLSCLLIVRTTAASAAGPKESPRKSSQQDRWDAAYRDGRRAPWDIGRPATDLKQAVENGTLRPCRAVELGCGPGNDAIYLASRGFDVTAIDIAPAALSQAEKKARQSGVKVHWLHADVLNPPKLEPFDLIYDRGCYHGVRRQHAAGYVETLRRLSRPGTQVLILAGNANEPPPHHGPPRVREADIRADFGRWFDFQWLRETRFDTTDPNRKGALAWSILLRRKAETLALDVKLDMVRQELHPDFCWFHPRVAAIPGAGREGRPAVIMTLQKHLAASDHYSGLWMMRTNDLGKTWTGPTEIRELAWRAEPDGVVIAVADVTPGWHPQTDKLIAMGCTVRYGKRGQQLSDVRRFSQTAYAVYDPKTGRWSKWQVLGLPENDKFNMARNACAQWLVLPDGTLLVPIYFGKAANLPASVTVLHCAFDGRKLSYLKHGDELSLSVVRGLCEPSIIAFQGRFYLTIRNDVKGYVTVSNDGLHYQPIKPWQFDDGSELGSYNTQQHWLAHQDGLFLVYTRRGANNDHIPRNRAPLFLAQVDPERLCVIRKTERMIVPERGAMLGNFGASAIDAHQSWVTVAEYVAKGRASPRGANGSVFAVRVLWSKPNDLAPRKAK